MAETEAGKVGVLGRLARSTLAFVLLGFALFCPFAKAQGLFVVWTSGTVGAILLATALIGRCPIYMALGRHS